MSRSALRTVAIMAAAMLAGCGAAPETATPGPVEAATKGVADVVKSEVAGRPIPREKLPDFVETMEGGVFGTLISGMNPLRTSGSLLYMVPDATVEGALAFHRASMERAGFTVGEPNVRKVRDTTEHSIVGTAADGRNLGVVVIDDGKPPLPIQMNYSMPKASSKP